MNFADKLHELQAQENELLREIEETAAEIKKHEDEGILNVGTYNGLKNKLTGLQNKLSATQAEKAELEGAAETAQSELTNEFEDIGGTGLPLRALASSEQAYQIISIFLQQKIGDMAEQHAAVVHSYKSENAMLSETVSELSKIKAEYEAFYRENIELSDKLADMTAKRDAAAAELEVLKAENARVKEDNAKLREQLENKTTARDTTMDLKKFAEELKANMKPIYNVRWKDERKRTHYLATLAETGEEIEIQHFTINSFRILEGEELARFQAELEAKKQAAVVEEPVQLAPSLEMPKPANDAEVSTDSISGEMVPATKAVTREEFEALKQQVNVLEQRVRGVA